MRVLSRQKLISPTHESPKHGQISSSIDIFCLDIGRSTSRGHAHHIHRNHETKLSLHNTPPMSTLEYARCALDNARSEYEQLRRKANEAQKKAVKWKGEEEDLEKKRCEAGRKYDKAQARVYELIFSERRRALRPIGWELRYPDIDREEETNFEEKRCARDEARHELHRLITKWKMAQDKANKYMLEAEEAERKAEKCLHKLFCAHDRMRELET